MTKATNVITVSPHLLARRNSECYNCKGKIKVGDKVCSKRTGSVSGTRTRWYCLACARRFNMI